MTLLTRTARSGHATAGLPTRLALSLLAGLMSLLVVLGLPADDAFAAAGPRQETAFEQRPTSEPATSLRTDRTALDSEESETHLRLGPAVPAPMTAAASAGCRPRSDDALDGTDRSLPERPPRA